MSTLGSLRCSVSILNGEYYNFWKDGMLDMFNEFNLNKYIHSSYVPPIDPLHPTPEEEIACFIFLEPSILSLEDCLEFCLVVCKILSAPICRIESMSRGGD